MSAGIIDAVPHDGPAAREIGFAVPERYNASAILFDNLAAGRGGRIAIHCPLGDVTYEGLAKDAALFGQGLLALGLKRGERVLMLLDDTPAYPAAFFGAIRAGLVPVMVNTLTPPELLRYYLDDSAARVAIVEPGFAGLMAGLAADGARLDRIIVVGDQADAEPAGAAQVTIASRWLAGFDGSLAAAATHRDDMAFWMYSSGSTGRPKGIVHLQHDMAYTAASYGRHVLALREDDICFSVPKIFFAYGLGNSLTFPFSVGAACVLLPGRPEPRAVLDCITRYRPSVFFGLPTLYTALVNAAEVERTDFSSLRLCVSAAEVLANETAAAWTAIAGRDIVEGLGSTEALHIYLSNLPGRRKPGAAGLRVPGYEVRLTDRDGRDAGAGEEGILWVRGGSSAPLYWNRPDKTAETFRDGWIWTGDRFTCDADGFFTFKGRADDLIKVSGQWVYPLEIELALADHPAVRECAVMAVELPDRRMTLHAFVVSSDGATDGSRTAELQAYVKQRLLPYKYPRRVDYLDELPKTGSGKIDRQALLSRPLGKAS
ncbi:benzoate-CoA ligase family protein [Phreatobacter stygius]|uniref:Benzoate-CoA ligase family protein n=1 Tax=Phreatobacter stygius TaxID=1940610 RepID=A0A4D7B192_9HYPH|nr:benzoate-CoA ligase family protein [Phreatobacter stygius]QCI64733.1 benzoate-CoA ligase family protein [Phreatobacter stygius]